MQHAAGIGFRVPAFAHGKILFLDQQPVFALGAIGPHQRKLTHDLVPVKAQLEIARGPEKAEVTFFHFGADQGGSAADNVTRWYAQFPGGEDKRITENVQVGPVKITFAMTEGTFNSGMPGGPTTPMEGYALCGAILETANGNLFVKMTGPNAVVKASTDAFKKMITDAAKTAAPKA